MTIEKKLLGTNPVDGAILPEAVSFDGTNDYLARTSDFTNNADGKTWTFSAWFYAASNGSSNIYSTYQNRVSIIFEGSYLNISLKSTTEDAMFESYPNIAQNTWNHILISCNQASTSQRHIYVNDKIYTQFNTYVNGNIDFTETQHYIGAANANHIYKMKGRIAHVFLDKTYRDLSVTANRRLFITADGKPSDTIPSNPIMYLPMKDAATAGVNSGTGGNFTAVGTLATAERGPNQDNCSASNFNGSNDYLFRSSIVGVSSTKQFTFSFNFVKTGGSSSVPMEFRNAANTYSVRAWQNAASYNIYIINNGTEVVVANISNADYNALNVDTGYKQNNVSISFDLSDTNKRYVYLNGTAATVTWATYTNQLIDMSQLNNWRVGNSGTGSAWWNGQLGEVYFNTAYTDLATSNPFWDSDTNRPNSVRKVIADTSVTPLIALPIIGNDAGNNLGSGGDFTVNSGPYTGARGGSEFWSRSAYFNGSSTDLTNTSLTGLSTGKQFTIAFGYSNFSYSDDVTIFEVGGGSGAGAGVYSKVFFTSSEVKIKCGNGSADHLEISLGRGATSGIIMISCDTSSAVDAIDFVIDGTYSDRSSGIIVQNSNITDSSENDSIIGNRLADNQTFNGSLGFIYVDDSYIDFSQEANRNKFVDQLGYPRDLTQQIEDGDISNPLIYMKFENTAALGTNSGSGGNFTVNGPFHAGRDITP